MKNLAPQDWKRVLDLLDTALELSAPERESWLETLGADHSSLKPALRELLARHAANETNDFLRALPQFTRVESGVDASTGELQPGADVGAYRLIRELGRGGMSAVWLAERVDGKVKRQVAMKFPYAGPAQRQLAERLLRERDILAGLEHPNIARLYDADVTSTGQPYLVLEYVDGIPIHDYCDGRRLSLRERLVLFLQVFNAVQYAHAHLVIHRDIKPSNILVSTDGSVHLLDFGIAKLTTENPATASPLTEFGGRAFTPDYASPEQIVGRSLTTSSDIYSLGVVLYELLAGTRPYRLKRDSRASLEEAIAEADVIAPSRALGEAGGDDKMARALRGDLDTIVLKALRKNPADRYVSADAFAQDIGRYLDGETVSARPDSAWYRTRKFIARNRVAAGAAASVVLALGAGLTIALWQLQVARAERQRAEDVKEFTSSIFRSADPNMTGNQSMTAVDLLTLARQRVDTELQGHPENAIELLVNIGESQLNLEQADAAQATLDKALELADGVLPPNDVRVLEAKAMLASVYGRRRDNEKAKALMAEIIPLLRQSGQRGARALVNVLQTQANVAGDENDEDTTLASSREAVSISTAAFGAGNLETIMAKRNLGAALMYFGHVPDAVPVSEEAYAAARALYPDGVTNGLVVDTEVGLGQVLSHSDQVEKAAAHLTHGIAAGERLYGKKNISLAGSMTYLIVAQERMGDMTAMLETSRRTFDYEPNDRGSARAKVVLGESLVVARKVPDGAKTLEDALTAIRETDTSKGSWLLRVKALYGHALIQAGRLNDAEKLFRENLQELGDAKKPNAVACLNGIGLIEYLSGRPQQSERAYRDALERSQDSILRARGKAAALTGLGLAQLAQGKAQQAEVTLREADKTVRIYYHGMAPPRADVLVALGRAMLAQGRGAEALPLLAEADGYWRDYDPQNRWAGEAAYWYGHALLSAGKANEGRITLARASKILQSSPIAGDARLAKDARNRSVEGIAASRVSL